MLSHSRTARLLGPAFALGMALAVPGPAALAQVPGRDAFAREPKTPLETWEVASYLIRIGQPAQAAPYIKKFLDQKPDDAAVLEVRDTYGIGSILALSDDPATRPYARPMADLVAGAASRTATEPTRIARAIEGLTKSKAEQDAAVDRLREAGPYAVAPLIQAIGVAGLEPSNRTRIADNIGNLDKNAVPALIAALDHPDDKVVGDVARALGRIGDPRAIPALTFLASRTNPPSFAKGEVVQALRMLTGRDLGSQPRTPVRVLSDEARLYHDHKVRFPGDPVLVWLFDAQGKVPKSAQVSVRDAEGLLGLRAAREALEVDPNDTEAKVIQIGLGLDHDPAAWRDQALAAGPDVLGKVLARAVVERRGDLAAAVVPLLGQLASRDGLTFQGRPSPLVDALISPDRRVQLAAAEALVKLDPRRIFPGSSRLVPTLARFLASQGAPRAIVIDGNAARGTQVAGFLKNLGYDARSVTTGAQGFTDAAEAADVELIAIDPDLINDSWKLPDILGNLKADPRTSAIPVFLYGPLAREDALANALESFPEVQFLVTPSETTLLKKQIDLGLARTGARPLSSTERTDFAAKASSLLAQISRNPGSPFEADLPVAEPGLTQALNGPVAAAALEAAAALGDVPGTDTQRSLADVAFDSSKPVPLRLASAGQLARNIRRFGPRLAPDQEKRLVVEAREEADPAVREALATVIGALRPGPDASASTFPTYRPSTP
jgi:HEAT repeat protein